MRSVLLLLLDVGGIRNEGEGRGWGGFGKGLRPGFWGGLAMWNGWRECSEGKERGGEGPGGVEPARKNQSLINHHFFLGSFQ